MSDATEAIKTYADALAAELVNCGHDDLTGTHLLDSLASTGLTLIPATDTAASEAYFERSR